MQGSTSHTQPLDLRAAAHSKSKRLTKSRTRFAALTEQPRVSTPHLASMNTSPDKQEPFHGFGGICSNQDQSVAAGCAGMGHSAPCTDSALTARAQLNPGTQTPTPKPHGLSQNSLDCSGSPHGFFPHPKTLLAMCRHEATDWSWLLGGAVSATGVTRLSWDGPHCDPSTPQGTCSEPANSRQAGSKVCKRIPK